MLQEPSFTIRTAARLHFGLWGWGCAGEREFGGVGMMIRQPELAVRFTNCSRFETSGAYSSRIREVANQCVQAWRIDGLPNCRIETLASPPQHAGFGVGTQLSLCVAAGLARWISEKGLTPLELALAAKRGLRSAIGTHGFGRGGLLIDAGKRQAEPVGELAARVAVSEQWRVLLITPRGKSGIEGEQERTAFANLPPVEPQTTQDLKRLAFEQIAPACESGDFARFAEAIYQYGRLAGECFATVQGGAYCSIEVAQTVERLRGMGVIGVGQSSWGPTVFGFLPNEEACTASRPEIEKQWDRDRYHLTFTQASNQGAMIEMRPGDVQPAAAVH